MPKQFITPDNLGSEFNQGGEIPDKITLSMKHARFPITPNTIANIGAPWNEILIGTPSIDTIGTSVSGGDVKLPVGVYMIDIVLNFFDDNSARAAHRERIMIDGAEYSSMEGHNYLRDATNHDSAANVYPDLFAVSDGQVLSIEAQTNSTLVGFTDVTGGWVRLLKIA